MLFRLNLIRPEHLFKRVCVTLQKLKPETGIKRNTLDHLASFLKRSQVWVYTCSIKNHIAKEYSYFF